MTRKNLFRKVIGGLLAGGLVFQLGIPSCSQAADFINPCGTIIANCSPFAFEGDGMIPDFGSDPSCTIQGLCGDSPFAGVGGGIFGGGPGNQPTPP